MYQENSNVTETHAFLYLECTNVGFIPKLCI